MICSLVLTLILSFVTRNVMKAAVAQAMSQVRPIGNRPHDGNSVLAVKFLLPIMEKVFDVPDSEDRGSDLWIRSLIQRTDYTFRDCVEHPRHAFTYSSHALTHALRHAFTYSSHALMHALILY